MSYIDDLNKRMREKNKETAQEAPSLNSYNQKTKAPSLSSRQTSGASFSSASRTNKPANNNWYQGNQPTSREILGQIGKISKQNPSEGNRILNMFQQERSTPGNPYYNPYAQATNRAVSAFTDDDIGSDDWQQRYAYTQGSLVYNGYTNTPSAPNKKSTPEQIVAYNVYQVNKSEPGTRAAEQEWKDLQDELKWKANNPGNYWSDDDIVNSVDWNNYPTLKKMREGGNESPMEFNRPIGFSEENMYGTIWSARNNGGTGDPTGDAIMSAAGEGKQWQEDPVTTAKMTKGSPTYSPHEVGPVALDKALQYFGIYEVTPEWIAENREPILNSGNETAIKYLGMFLDAEDTTVAATEETAKLNKKIEGWVNRSGMTNERLQQNINNYINDECPTLLKIDKGIYNPNHLVPTNRAIPYNKNQMILDAQAQLQDNTVKPSAMASMANLVNEIGQLGQQKTTDWTEVKNKSNMSRSFANGFQEGRDVAGGMASATDGLTLEREEEEAGQQQVTDSEDELENAPSAVDDANVPAQEDVPQESAMNPQSPEVAVADAENAATAQKRVKPLLGDSLKKNEAVTPEEPEADLNEKQPDSLLPSKFHSEILEEQYWQEDKRLSDVIDSIDWRDEIPEQASFENDPSPRTDSINAMFNDIVNADGDQIKLGVNRLVAKNGTQEYFGSGIASQYYLNTYRQHKDNYDYSLSNENKLFAELGENFILSQEEIEKNPTQEINVNGKEAVLNYARDEEGGLYINGITIDGHEYFISDNFTLDDAAWVLDENNEVGARQIIDNSMADMISHDDAVREAKANAPEPTDEQKAKYQEYLAYRASRIVNEDWLGKNNTEYGRQLAINTDAENNWDFMISRMSEEGYDTADLETAHGVATFTGRFGKAYTPVVYAYTGKKDENGNLVFEPTNQKSAYWCDNVIDSILTGKLSPEEEEQAMAWMENQAEERRAAIQNIDFTIAFCEDSGIEIPAEYKANMLKSKERMQRELDAYDYGKLVLTPEAREKYNTTDWEDNPMLQFKASGKEAPVTKGIGTKFLDFIVETGGGNPFSKVQNGDEKDEQWIFSREASPRELLIYSTLAQENPEAAEKYLHFMANQGTGILTTRQVEEYEEDSQNMVDSGFVGGTAATLLALGTAPLETVEALGFYGHALIHGEYPEHSSYLKLYKGNAVTPSAVNNSINETLGEDSALGVLCKGLYSILYNNGRSLVSGKTFSGFTDLFMSSGSALGKLLDVTPISLAASAASAESTYAITDNPTAATLMGIITFVCEAGSEFIEFGNLEKALTAGTLEGSLKAYRRGLPANALAEGFGEWLNNVVENNANDIILKDDSEFEQSVYGHLCNGARTIEEARARARKDRFNDDIFTFITSSMGTFLEAGGVIGSYAARKTNARISTSIYNRTHPGHEITTDQFLLQRYGSRADELVSNNVTQSALNDYMLLEHAAQDSSSISSAAFARVISEDMDTGLAAAVNGQNLFGGRKTFAGMLKSLVNGSAMSKETTDAMKQGIVFATLGGNESACAQLVRSDEFWNMTPNNKATALAEAAQTDAQNETVQSNVQSAVYDNRVANEEKKIIAKGLDNSLALKTAKKKLDSAKETLDAATKELDRVTNELKQAQDGLKTTGEIATQDASTANLDQLVSQGKAVARANQVVNEYEQSVQNKQQAVTEAEQAHADAQQEYLDSVRNQARQNVVEIDQHRAEIKEKMEQAKAVAEQNRMVRREVDNIARMQGDAIIIDLQNKGYNPTAEEQEKIYRMVNQMRQEMTPEAFQRRDEFARQISRKFGIPISFEDTTHGGVVERQNGYYDAKKNRIVIDQNSSINDTMYVVLGHELTHAAEKSGTYKELSDALIATEYNGNDNRLQADILARQTLYNNRLSKMHEQDSSIDATPLTEKEAKQEIVADLMGKLLRGDQELANRLAADSPNVVKRIINSIKSFLNKIRGVDGDFRTNSEKIVDMLENALKDAQAQKGTETDTSNVKKQFDLSAPVEVRDDGLVAVHNIGVDNLNSVIRMGTIPAPSLAIIAENSSWTSFAPISLYFNGNVALDAIKNGRAYTGDAMTPTLGIREHTSAEGALEYIKQQPERSYESDNLIEAFEGYKRISNVDEARGKLYRKQGETDEGRKEINRVLNEKQFNVNSIVKDAINRSLVTVEGMTGEEATDYEIKNSRMIEKAIGIGALEGYEAIQKKMADGTRVWNIDTVGMIGESVEEKLKAYLHRDFSGLDLQNNEELEEAVMDFADYANENMSSGMVEAKPYENIDFSNIAEIHVPSSLAQGKVDEIMAGLGLDESQVKTYDPNVAGSREELARNVAKQNDRVRFSLPEVEGTDGSLVELPGGTVAQSEEYSISSWTDEEKTKAINKLIENGFKRADIDKWINDIDDIGLAIAEDALRLDFTPDREQSFLKSNSDVYKYTLDASTLCAKRLLYQGTFNAIQKAMPNTPLYAGDLIELANMMRDMGYQVPCAICYVESQRRDTGKFTEQFIDKYAKEHEGGFVPTYADLTSSDGLYKLREEHPEVYKAYIKANNKRGNASIKPVELRTDYRGEVRDFTKNMVNYLKSIGGLRVQSFSDFETPHLMDMMQAVLDMSAVGLTSQAYTKVPNFAWVFGDTGIKINLSLMGEGTGVDENGNLVFSSIEGMDFNEAMKIRDRYSKNVGTILVGMNDAHILAAMADPRIDYIIPFHRSGWSKENRAKMKALANYTDYQDFQNERTLEGYTKEGKPVYKKAESNFEPVGPNGYWDFNKSGKENAETYLRLCAEKGVVPKFDQFLDRDENGHYHLKADGSTDGYWKTLIDFKMYENGGDGSNGVVKGSPQTAVTPNINMAEAFRTLNEFDGTGVNSLPVASDVVEQYVEQYKKNHPLDEGRTRYSLPADSDYLSAVNHGDMEEAQRAVEQKAKQAGYTEKAYHGTIDFGFTEFDMNKSQDMIFVSYNKAMAESYATNYDEVTNGLMNISDAVKLDKPVKELNGQELVNVAKKLLTEIDGEEIKSIEYNNETNKYYINGYEAYVTEIKVPLEREISKRQAGIYQLYTRPGNQLVVDAGDVMWDSIPWESVLGEPSDENEDLWEEFENDYYIGSKETTTRGVANWAKDHGYDSVRINNVWDYGGFDPVDTGSHDIGIFFTPNDVKSADPVTYNNDGTPISLSERFSEANRDIRYSLPSDAPYLNAVNHGDMDEAQRIIDQKAQEAGYIKAAFHGTLNGGFTIFDKAKAGIGGNSGAGFYFSSNESDSEANYSDVEGADNWFKANHLAERIIDERDNSDDGEIEYEGYKITEEMSTDDIVEIAKEILTKNPETYHVYLDPGKTYIRDFNNSTNLLEGVIDNFDESLYDRNDYDNEDDWYDALSMGRSDEIYQAIYDAVYDGIADVDSNYEIISNVNYEDIIGKLTEIAMDYESLTWNDLIKVLDEQYIDIMTPDMEESADGSREIARAIVEAFGFDSIEDREVSKKFNQLRNMGNAGDTVHYIMFHPNQIKLADAVTYDDQGNIIPPSERFREQNNDIRYSLPSDEILDQMIRQYILDDQNRGLPPAGTGLSAEVSPEENGNAYRQFGRYRAQESDALHQEVKDYLYNHSRYTQDSNQAQIDRAINWVRSQQSEGDPDGYYAALNEVTSDTFDYRSADGQARMLTVMSMAALKAQAGDRRAQEDELRIADAYNKQGTVLGQMLQARKIFRLMTSLGRVAYIQKMATAINDSFARQGKTNTVQLSPWLLQAASEATTEEDFDKVQKAASRELAAQMPADWKTAIRSFRMLSMLANPKTHIRNIIGNALFIPAVSLKNKMGALMELGLDKGQRTKTLAPIMSKSVRDFARKDADAMKGMLTGEAKFNELNSVQKEQNEFGNSGFGRFMKGLSDLNGGLLEGEDWFFLKGHYRRALGGWIQANGYTVEQLQSNPNLLEQGREYAITEAQKATYRDYNEIAKKLNNLTRDSKTFGGKVLGFGVDALLPFKKTPLNILRRGVEYSPVGLVKSLTADAIKLHRYYEYQRGNLKVMPENAITPNQFIDNICAGLTGTAITALGMLLSSAGVISCGFDDDDDEFDKMEGAQEYSINPGKLGNMIFGAKIFGEDVTYTLDWAAPMCMPLFVGAAIQDQVEDGIDISEIANAALSISEPVFNLSMLDGLSSVFSIGQSSGAEAVINAGAKIGANYITSFVPSVLGAVARSTDTVRRKSFVPSGESSGPLGTLKYAFEGSVQNKIPFWNQQNIPMRDAFGRVKSSGSVVKRIAENFVSPGYISNVEHDPVIEELRRLHGEGIDGMVPKMPAKTITVNKERIALSAEQYDQLTEDRGSTAYGIIQDLMSNDYYKNASPDYQAAMIDDVWTYATQNATYNLNNDYTMTSWVLNGRADPVKAIVSRSKTKQHDDAVNGYKLKAVEAVDSGDEEALENCVTGLEEMGVEKARDKVKTAVAKKYRPLYIRAYQDNDEAAMIEIENKLTVDFDLGFDDGDFEDWTENSEKYLREDEEE